MRISFIGGGVMAEAILSRSLAAGIFNPADVNVAEPIEARRDQLTTAYGVAVTSDNRGAAAAAEIVLLAVKPQQIKLVYEDLRDGLNEHQTVISIAAGVTLVSICEGLEHRRAIRVMPNTPAQIGAGMSVWTTTADVTEEVHQQTKALLRTLGKEWYVDSEDYLDMATAISGSGPAYVFAFIEALTEAGMSVGMPRNMAQTLATETAVGATKLAQESGEDPALLRQMVTSPGGTTEAALREFDRGQFKTTLINAAGAAYRRARELGGNS